jgi:hypothetical protein
MFLALLALLAAGAAQAQLTAPSGGVTPAAISNALGFTPLPPSYAQQGVSFGMFGDSHGTIGMIDGAPYNFAGGYNANQYTCSAQNPYCLAAGLSKGLIRFDPLGYQPSTHGSQVAVDCTVGKAGTGYAHTDYVTLSSGQQMYLDVNSSGGVIGCATPVSGYIGGASAITSITTLAGYGAYMNAFTPGAGDFSISGEITETAAGTGNYYPQALVSAANPPTAPFTAAGTINRLTDALAASGNYGSHGAQVSVWGIHLGGDDTDRLAQASVTTTLGSNVVTAASALPYGYTDHRYFFQTNATGTSCFPLGTFIEQMTSQTSFTVGYYVWNGSAWALTAANSTCATQTRNSAIEGVELFEMEANYLHIWSTLLAAGKSVIQTTLPYHAFSTCKALGVSESQCALGVAETARINHWIVDYIQQKRWAVAAPKGANLVLYDDAARQVNPADPFSFAFPALISTADLIHPSPAGGAIEASDIVAAEGPILSGAGVPAVSVGAYDLWDSLINPAGEIGSSPTHILCGLTVGQTTFGAASGANACQYFANSNTWPNGATMLIRAMDFPPGTLATLSGTLGTTSPSVPAIAESNFTGYMTGSISTGGSMVITSVASGGVNTGDKVTCVGCAASMAVTQASITNGQAGTYSVSPSPAATIPAGTTILLATTPAVANGESMYAVRYGLDMGVSGGTASCGFTGFVPFGMGAQCFATSVLGYITGSTLTVGTEYYGLIGSGHITTSVGGCTIAANTYINGGPGTGGPGAYSLSATPTGSCGTSGSQIAFTITDDSHGTDAITWSGTQNALVPGGDSWTVTISDAAGAYPAILQLVWPYAVETPASVGLNTGDQVYGQCAVTVSNAANVNLAQLAVRTTDAIANYQLANGTGPMISATGAAGITQIGGTMNLIAATWPLTVDANSGNQNILQGSFDVQMMPNTTGTLTVTLSNCGIYVAGRD